ncbi:RICIN domain-containing protein [Cystobacter fuscus]
MRRHTRCGQCPGRRPGRLGAIPSKHRPAGGAGPYTFGANVGSSMCLDVHNGSPDPRTNIQVWNCTGDEPQRFWVENQGDGLVRLVNTGTNRCVDIDNAGSADGTNIQTFPCNLTNSQKFRIEDGGNGKVRIVNPQSNKCLDVAEALPRGTRSPTSSSTPATTPARSSGRRPRSRQA